MEVLEKEKILVIQTAFLGDAVLTLPMIQKLKENFFESSISVLCIPSTKELFECSPVVDEVIVYDKKGGQKSILSFFNLIRLIRQKRFNRIYSPHRSFRTSLIVLLSGSPYTTGFDKASFSFVYKRSVKYLNESHEVARNLELIGINTAEIDWKILPIIDIPEVVQKKIKNLYSNLNTKKIAAVAPASVWNTKVYPEKYFIKLINYLVSQNYFVVLIAGNEDAEQCQTIINQFSSSVTSFAGSLSVIESIELLKHCSVLITNDSAPTHLAMIADIPALTIYCSTIPAFGFYPYNKKSQYISYNDLSCKPCGIHGHKSCPIETFDCGYKLMPVDVISTLQKIISE